MKNFVFNLLSGDTKKFENGEELFNLIVTCLVFDQKVTVVLKEIDKQALINKYLNHEKNLVLVKLDEARSLIEKSDFYLEC
tara:strand:+ start:374 stop:616 length:243 start_codon:yes stop_codon:yes gene_type:complete